MGTEQREGLGIWFSEDIRNALLAANEANASTVIAINEAHPSKGYSPHDRVLEYLRAYREGYKAALATVALAFGIAPQAVVGREDCQGQDANINKKELQLIEHLTDGA